MVPIPQATGDDPELIRFLQQWAGYCLTGSTCEHALLFIHGGGGEGKSTFVKRIAGAMGDYAVVSSMEMFTASFGNRHATGVAKLRGGRLVTASETA